MKQDTAMAAALILKKHSCTIAIAESCTGGEISASLTAIPGASMYFLGACVAYSNEIKTRILKIDSRLLKKEGAVSNSTALGMAKNIRRMYRSHFGLSVTGIAGPKGAEPSKPVGTVFIGLAWKGGHVVEKHRFSGSRESVRAKSANAALFLLRNAVAHQFKSKG